MYTKACNETTQYMDNDVLEIKGLVAFVDNEKAQWFSPIGHTWHQYPWNADPESSGFSCLSEFLDFYNMEVCSQKEALEFLDDCKKRLYPMDHCGHSS